MGDVFQAILDHDGVFFSRDEEPYSGMLDINSIFFGGKGSSFRE